MKTDNALTRLLKMVPPPAAPLEILGEPAALQFSSGDPLVFPSDYLALNLAYGSGWFKTEGPVSMIVTPCNPFAAPYAAAMESDHSFYSQYKRDEGGGFTPYEIFPRQAGLLQWGWAEGRKHFFWLTEGEPSQWPTIILWDLEFLARVDLPVTEFLAQLIAGDLPCAFIGDESKPVRLDPALITFQPRAMPKH